MTWSLTIHGHHPMNSNLQAELDEVHEEARQLVRRLRQRGHHIGEAKVNEQPVQANEQQQPAAT